MSSNGKVWPKGLREELDHFEAKYGISSEEFYRRLLNFEVDGSPDNDRWSQLCGQAVLAGLIPVPQLPPISMPEGVHIEVVRLTPEVIGEKLAQYEAERGMTSAEFYERYKAGLEGDSWDVMEWSWLYELSVKKGLKPSPSRA